MGLYIGGEYIRGLISGAVTLLADRWTYILEGNISGGTNNRLGLYSE